MEMNEDEAHKRKLWYQVSYFAYQAIRIKGSFSWIGENLNHANEQFQCLIRQRPTSRININYNKDSQEQNLKNKRRMQEELETFSTKLQIPIKAKSLGDKIGKIWKLLKNQNCIFLNLWTKLYLYFGGPRDMPCGT